MSSSSSADSSSSVSMSQPSDGLLAGKEPARRKMSPMGRTLEAGTWPEEMNMLEPTINCLMFFDRLPTPQLMADAVEQTLWPCYRFHSCMAGGFWERRHSHMDRAYHFNEVHLENEQAIEDWTQKAMFQTLDKSFPPWKVTFLHVRTGRPGMFWQLHHVIGDGLGIMFAGSPMMGVEGGDVLAKIPLPTALLPKDKQKEKSKSAAGGGGGGGGGGCKCAPAAFCRGMLVPALTKHDTELRFNSPLDQRTPFLKFNGNRVFTRFPNVPMSKVKAIKDQQKCSVNDVLMAALTGALRRYGADELKDPVLHDDYRERIEFKTLAMMALPRPVDSNDMAGSLANKMLFTTCKLPLGEPTPLGRLEHTIESFADLKSKPFMMGLIGLTDMVSGVAPSSVMQKLASELFSKHTLLVTNVPCTSCEITLPKEGGVHLSELHMVFPNIISQVSIITYNGHVNCNIVADPALFPQPAKLAKLWFEEFDELVKATSPAE